MTKFRFKTSQVLQGDFHLTDLNLLVAFQVNCPGCFIYALPLAGKLHHEYGDRLNILGLSTAFEDFDLNTAEHTQCLVETGEIVGATKLYFSHHGEKTYTLPIHFPVAFDQVGSGPELFDSDDVEHICSLTPSFPQRDKDTQQRIRQRVRQVITSRPIMGYTFSVNQFQGTPSWVLFDGDSNILAQWFGHKSEAEVMALIASVSGATDEIQAIA